MGDRFENTAIIETPDLDDYIRLVTKEGGTRRALASELAKKIVEEYEGSELGGEERTIQAAIADAKQVASEAIQEEQTAREEADTAINADLAKKAYADGEYSDLHAGTANQILSDTYTTDEEPYHYRQTPSHAGTREIDEIVGGSVVWNQLVNTSTSSVTVTSGHKYVAKISDAWSVGASTGTALNVTGGTDMVFDITQMFPTAIADHIYALEQETAGAGVAFFRKYFPEEYYAYDAGSIQSVTGISEHRTVGFNQFDITDFVKTYPDYCQLVGDELQVNATYEMYSTGLEVNIPCDMAGGGYARYDIKCGTGRNIRIKFFHSDGTYEEISGSISTMWETKQKSLSAKQIVAIKCDWSTGGTFSLRNFCINLSNTAKNGTYAPYEKHTYPLDSTVTLRGIPQLVDGQLKFDGDTYSADGTITRRYGVVDLGTLGSWIRAETTDGHWRFRATLASVRRNAGNQVANMICTKYNAITGAESYNGTKDGITGYDTGGYIFVHDETYETVEAFKTAMSGQYLVYELATPTTEQAEPYQSLQTCSPYGTEEYVTTEIVPVGHYTKYPTDLKGIVEQIADAPSSDGTYTLKATVSGGKVTYSWESA